MKVRILFSGLLISLFFGPIVFSADIASEDCLQVYLPREAVVEGGAIKLGDVSILRGSDQETSQAGGVGLGSFCVAGQLITLDRAMIESRLRCSGVKSVGIEFSGAESVTVRRKSEIVKGVEFAEMAESFLSSYNPEAGGCNYRCLRIPEDFIVPGDANGITFSTHLAGSSQVSGYTKVNVCILNDGNQAGVRQVTFRRRWEVQRVVTTQDVMSGQEFSRENIKVVKGLSDQAQRSDWQAPYGLVARRDMAAGTVVDARMVSIVTEEIIVKRNENVLIKIDKPGLLITTFGKALENGKCGENIKVRNNDSNRTILARVNADGSVEPVI
jgi:flagella basal body P-ring formation protein FlgA